MVFESFSQDVGWDGTYKGKVAKQDVYMWKVIGKFTSGKSFTKTVMLHCFILDSN
jgi:hypothetical protein